MGNDGPKNSPSRARKYGTTTTNYDIMRRCDDIESVRKHLQIPIFNKDIIKRDTF